MRKFFSISSAGLMIMASTLVVLVSLVASTGIAAASITTPRNGATVQGTITVTMSPGGQENSYCHGRTSLAIYHGSTKIKSWSDDNGGSISKRWDTGDYVNGTYVIKGHASDGHRHWYGTCYQKANRDYSVTVHVRNTSTLSYSGATSGALGTSVTMHATLRDHATGHALPNDRISFHLSGGATRTAKTNSSGVATVSMPLNGPPRSTTVTATWGGSSYHVGSHDSHAFRVQQDPTRVSLSSSDAASVWGEPVRFTATVSGNPQGGGTPTGHVQFSYDGHDLGSAVALSNGRATSPTISSLTVAHHTIEAYYKGDDPDYIHNSTTMTQTVDKAATSVAVSSSDNPAEHGEAVHFGATVTAKAPGAGSVTGTVQFAVDGAPLGGPVALAGGHATSPSISTMATGNHQITATYAGDGHFDGTTGSLGEGVDRAQTATGLTSTDGDALVGEPVTVTATVVAVAPGEGVPGGTVQFAVDGTPTGPPVALHNGQASFDAGGMAPGSHDITAAYAGDGDFAPSTGGPLVQLISPAPTTLSLASSANPSVFGQSVTLTATVTVPLPGAGTPTGTVTFSDGTTTLGTVPLTAGASGDRASIELSSFAVGSHAVTATYSGDTDFTASHGQLTQTVKPAGTATTVASSANPSVFGQSVTLTATVTVPLPGAGTPTGTVTFSDGTTTLGTVPLTAGASGDRASIELSSFAVGSHAVTATYSGDTDFTASQGTISQVVTKAPTALSLSSSENPSTYGEAVTFTARVSVPSPGAGAPSGTVSFAVSGVPLGAAVPLTDGSATSPPLTGVAPGTYAVTATYSGDGDFAGSHGGVSQRVSRYGASITAIVSVSPSPSVATQPVTIMARVSSAGGAAALASGTVDFYDGPYLLGYGQLHELDGDAIATITTSDLSIGQHQLSAAYLGSYDYAPSTSDPIGHTVTRIGTTTALSSSANPSVAGQDLTYTARVTPAYGAGTPAGTVTFSDGTTTLGTEPLQAVPGGAAASIDVPAPALGAHHLTATYDGGTTYAGSTGTLTQNVGQGATSVAVVANSTPTAWGQPTTFTATVSAEAPATGLPTGTVSFSVDGADLPAPESIGDPVALDADGSATSEAISSLGPGSYTVTATYSGDASFTAASGQTNQVVTRAATTTALVAAPKVSLLTQSVTLTATVAIAAPGAGTPTGTVTFHDGSATLGTRPLSVHDGVAEASLATSGLSVGSHQLTATYSGDPHAGPSTSAAVTQVVNRIPTTVTVLTSTTPSTYGDPVTVTATVQGTFGDGTPTGTVTFTDGDTTLGTVPLSGSSPDTASLRVSSLGGGEHTITATYSGDAAYLGAHASATQDVQAAATSISASDAVVQLGGLLGNSVLGPLTAVLHGPAGPVAGQKLVFTAGSTALCTATTGADGTATCNASSQFLAVVLAGGYHVAFAGTNDYQASSASPGLVYGQIG